MTATILNQLKEAFRLMIKQPKYLAYAALADMIFIYTIVFFSSALWDKMLEYAIAASSLAAKSSSEIGSIVASSNTLFQGLLSISGVREFVYDIIIIGIILALGIYIIYCFFQGISWYLAGKIANSKQKYSAFMRSFFKINLLWLAIYALFGIIKLAVGFRQQIASQPYAGDTLNISIIIPTLAAIFIYYAAISYSRIFIKNKKSLAKEGYNNARYLIPRYIAIALIIAIIHMLQWFIYEYTIVLSDMQQIFLFKYNIVLSGVIFLAVELPSFTFARIFIINIMEEKHEKK